MKQHSLDKFIKNVRNSWGPFNAEMVMKFQNYLNEFVSEVDTKLLLKDLEETPQKSAELYRDPDYGFLLLAHVETEGLYRIPHDHGNCWVLYAVQSGEMEMRTYEKKIDEKGNTQITIRETYPVTKGKTRAYLPGDIHDTKCISPRVLMFRFTSCDLKNETLAGKINRYVI